MAYLYLTGNSTPEWGNFSQEDTVIEIFCPKQLAELNAGWSDLPTRLGYLGFALLEPCLGCESLIPSLCISVVSLFRPHSACVGLCWIHEEFQRSKPVYFFQNSMQPCLTGPKEAQGQSAAAEALCQVRCLQVTECSVLFCLPRRCTRSEAHTGVNTVPISCGGSSPKESAVQVDTKLCPLLVT